MKWVMLVVWVKAHAVVTGTAAFDTQKLCLEAEEKVIEKFPEADYSACFIAKVED